MLHLNPTTFMLHAFLVSREKNEEVLKGRQGQGGSDLRKFESNALNFVANQRWTVFGYQLNRVGVMGRIWSTIGGVMEMIYVLMDPFQEWMISPLDGRCPESIYVGVFGLCSFCSVFQSDISDYECLDQRNEGFFGSLHFVSKSMWEIGKRKSALDGLWVSTQSCWDSPTVYVTCEYVWQAGKRTLLCLMQRLLMMAGRLLMRIVIDRIFFLYCSWTTALFLNGHLRRLHLLGTSRQHVQRHG